MVKIKEEEDNVLARLFRIEQMVAALNDKTAAHDIQLQLDYIKTQLGMAPITRYPMQLGDGLPTTIEEATKIMAGQRK